MSKSYRLDLPYFRQGNDLAFSQTVTPTDAAAFMNHANILKRASEMLERCEEEARKGNLSIEYASTHCISIDCSEEVGDRLVEEGLLSIEEWEDEED